MTVFHDIIFFFLFFTELGESIYYLEAKQKLTYAND